MIIINEHFWHQMAPINQALDWNFSSLGITWSCVFTIWCDKQFIKQNHDKWFGLAWKQLRKSWKAINSIGNSKLHAILELLIISTWSQNFIVSITTKLVKWFTVFLFFQDWRRLTFSVITSVNMKVSFYKVIILFKKI